MLKKNLKRKKENVNKIEPRFNIGDWITHNIANFVFKIISVGPYGYEVVSRQNFKKTISFESEDKYYLWSIEDAKPGDILAFNDDTIVIFKDLYNKSTFHSYCHIEDGLFDISKDEMPDWLEGKGFHPATKEQCEFLFQKMKESGYVWDSNKKELKKIGVDIFHIGDVIRFKGHSCDGVITEITDTDYICGNAKIPISSQDKLELVEEKSVEWNQANIEDLTDFEKAFQGMCCEKNKQFAKECCKILLELAKKQLQSTLKTEWNEEDEKMCQNILECLKNGWKKLPTDILKYESWLKSFKYQNYWKPTKE